MLGAGTPDRLEQGTGHGILKQAVQGRDAVGVPTTNVLVEDIRIAKQNRHVRA